MKLYFRPMPGLTIATVIALVILISLGTWQYQRLQWKTTLLADVDRAAEAAPFTNFSEIQEALDRGDSVDFRRIGTKAEHLPANPYFVFTSQNSDISWRRYSPVVQKNTVVFAALDVVSDTEKTTGVSGLHGATDIVGYIRLARPKPRGQSQSTPETNRWFGFNPKPQTHNWGDQVGTNADMRFYIDTVPEAKSANALSPRRPDIRNNHFDYMLTWYGLAIVLLVIYLILHRRAGRLGRT